MKESDIPVISVIIQSYNNLTGHLKIHKESKHLGIKYPCDHCSANFSTKSNLKSHVARKHGDKVEEGDCQVRTDILS